VKPNGEEKQMENRKDLPEDVRDYLRDLRMKDKIQFSIHISQVKNLSIDKAVDYREMLIEWTEDKMWVLSQTDKKVEVEKEVAELIKKEVAKAMPSF